MVEEELPRLKIVISQAEWRRLNFGRMLFYGMSILMIVCIWPIYYRTMQVIDCRWATLEFFCTVPFLAFATAVFIYSLVAFLTYNRRLRRYWESFTRCTVCGAPCAIDRRAHGERNLACTKCRTPLVLRPAIFEITIEGTNAHVGPPLYKLKTVKGQYALPRSDVVLAGTESDKQQPAITIGCESCGGSFSMDASSAHLHCPHCGGTRLTSDVRASIDESVTRHSERLGSVQVLDDGTTVQSRKTFLDIGGGARYLAWAYVVFLTFLIITVLTIGSWESTSSRTFCWTTFILSWAAFGVIVLYMRHKTVQLIQDYIKNNIECPLCNHRIRFQGLYDMCPTQVQCQNCGLDIAADKGIIRTKHKVYLAGKMVGVVFRPVKDEYLVDFRMLRKELSRNGIDITVTNCPNCGAEIEFPDVGVMAHCAYCDTDFSSLQLGWMYEKGT